MDMQEDGRSLEVGKDSGKRGGTRVGLPQQNFQFKGMVGSCILRHRKPASKNVSVYAEPKDISRASRGEEHGFL